VIVIDLDGTLIPYDFVTQFHKFLLRANVSIYLKIFGLLITITAPLIRRFYTLALSIVLRARSSHSELFRSSKYFKISYSKSFYAFVLRILAKFNNRAIDALASVAISAGLKSRRNAWLATLSLCRTGKTCILATGNHTREIIQRVSKILNVSCTFHSVDISFGDIVAVLVLDKGIVSSEMKRRDIFVDVVVSDSLDDIRAFGPSRFILVK